jgi:purine-nucleoside phosphorylase
LVPDHASDFAQIDAAADSIRQAVGSVPEIAVVLGSGLGDFAGTLSEPVVLPYEQIPHWPVSRVVGHAGRLVAGTVVGRRVLALAGRSHFYEGHSMGVVTFATRVLGRLGVKVLVITNAAGGINERFATGALMVIDDHVNFMGTNPLVGPNDDRFGARFPDMSEVYSRRLRGLADQAARQRGVALEHGIYVAVCGPSYETPAEIRAFGKLGADAVGMSTVPETIVARQCGLRVAGLSCITNLAAGRSKGKLSHKEVLEAGHAAGPQAARLLEHFAQLYGETK